MLFGAPIPLSEAHWPKRVRVPRASASKCRFFRQLTFLGRRKFEKEDCVQIHWTVGVAKERTLADLGACPYVETQRAHCGNRNASEANRANEESHVNVTMEAQQW